MFENRYVSERGWHVLDENLGAVDVSLSDDQFDRIFEARYDEDRRLYRTNT